MVHYCTTFNWTHWKTVPGKVMDSFILLICVILIYIVFKLCAIFYYEIQFLVGGGENRNSSFLRKWMGHSHGISFHGNCWL